MKLNAESTLALMIKTSRLPDCHREYAFHPVRKWRFDFAFVAQKLAVEVEGGLYNHGKGKKLILDKTTGKPKFVTQQSRHLTIKGFEEDCRKYNAAAALGWRVLRVSTGMVKRGEALQAINAALNLEQQEALA